MPLINISGRTFGQLRISDRYRIEPHGTHAEWYARCTCGAKLWVRGTKLRSGRQVSCGCSKRDPEKKRAARWQLSPARRRAIAQQGAAARKR